MRPVLPNYSCAHGLGLRFEFGEIELRLIAQGGLAGLERTLLSLGVLNLGRHDAIQFAAGPQPTNLRHDGLHLSNHIQYKLSTAWERIKSQRN